MLEREVVVIGAGPAGMAAAIEAAKRGAQVLLVDSNRKAGGQLFKQIHKFFGSSAHRAGVRGIDIGVQLLREAEEYGVETWLNSLAIGLFNGKTVAIEIGTDAEEKRVVTVKAQKIIICSGASENVVRFKGWTLPGVMGAGAAQTMVNVNRVLPGEKILMVGTGNVGLIVSYQLMQAGADIVALVDVAPNIGGYAVHASKITRAGVPILTCHTVLEARGAERVEQAVIVEVDDHFAPIPGTEEVVDCDTIAIGAGLKPVVELAAMYGCEMYYNAIQGGWVPVHNRSMETTMEGIYIAGDITGVEEANTALEEGRLAGIDAAAKLGYVPDAQAKEEQDAVWERLDGLRLGPHGEKRHEAKMLQIRTYEERMGGERACR